MPETEPTRFRWLRVTHNLSAKLNMLLLGAMVVIFALLGYLNVRLHRQAEQGEAHGNDHQRDRELSPLRHVVASEVRLQTDQADIQAVGDEAK